MNGVDRTDGARMARLGAHLDTLELDLDAHPGMLDGKVLRDPGLYPGYTYFHANTRTGWLRYVPGVCNILQSVYRWIAVRPDDDLSYLAHARLVFLDSGAISPLIAVSQGKADPSIVVEWVARQNAVLDAAWQMYEAGVRQAVVAALDLPQYDALLLPSGLTRADAMQITLGNAGEFLAAWRRGDLPAGYVPVFSVQGTTRAEYLACMDTFEELGILSAVRSRDAWLAVGGTRDTAPPALYTIYQAVRERLGPGHIHALGVGRQPDIVYMATRGWIDGSDSSASTQGVLFNRGPYEMRNRDLARPYYMTETLFAATACHFDAQLAAALAEARAQPLPPEQGALIP